MIPVFGYVRVSSLGQVEGDGITRQRTAIEAYCASHDMRLQQLFVEEGVSGTLLERPQWQELLIELLSDGVQHVVVEKLDRLARDLMIQETIIGDLEKNGRTLISTMEPDLCSDDPSRKLIRQVFGAIAEYDRAMIVAKLRAARIRKKQLTGRCEGRLPYGARPRERRVVRQIHRLYDEGLSYEKIACQLNKDRFPAPAGGARWHKMTVRRIVRRGKLEEVENQAG